MEKNLSRFCVGKVTEENFLQREVALVCMDGNSFEDKLMKQVNVQQILKLITSIFYGLTFYVYKIVPDQPETHVRYNFFTKHIIVFILIDNFPFRKK